MPKPTEPPQFKILIVDDTPSNIEVLHKTLEPEGYALSVVTNGRMALDIVARLKPDLILLDIMMPEIDGFQACKELKDSEATREIPVIFISAKGEVADIVEGFRLGGVDYITKPIRAEEVLSRVKTHLQLGYLKREQAKRIQELEFQNYKLQELDNIKNRFLGTAMHDLRNPLSSISGFSDLFLLGEDKFSDKEKKELIEIINQTSKELMGLVQNLLDISVFESGELRLKLYSGNLSSLVEKQVKMSRVLSQEKNIDIVTSLEKIPDSLFDVNRIGQVLDNFISNAIKFSQPGTSIEVGLRRMGDRLEFYIRDEGPGISEEDQPKLFTAFPKINVYPTAGEKSTGLGLSIVKKIVDAHSGIIQVESEVGKGTTFRVQLPQTPR